MEHEKRMTVNVLVLCFMQFKRFTTLALCM